MHQHRGTAEHGFARIRIEKFEHSGIGARHQAFNVRELGVGDVQWKLKLQASAALFFDLQGYEVFVDRASPVRNP
jgi:hypothetical protein